MDGYKPVLAGLRPEEVEEFIGISGYSTSTPGIGGVVKERAEDFLVWESLLNGLDARRAFESMGYAGGVGGHILSVLWKRGVDTIRASTIIARLLGVKPSLLGFCGIKDKMSVSWQFMTIPQNLIDPENVLEVDRVIRVKPVKAVERRLSSRDLLKNNFEVVIRRVRLNSQVVEEALTQLRDRGLPNFYGHQRFGVTRPITHVVGRLILEGRLEEAVSAFLADYSPLESEGNREARRKLLEHWDLRWAAENFPRTLRYEREVARYLIENPGDYAGALRVLPLRLRRLMVESVSAFTFNKALSNLLMRGEEFAEPEPGDFALPLTMGGRPERRVIRVRRFNLQQVRRLVEEGRIVVALPVPGYLTEIPRSGKGEALAEALDELGLELKMFRVRSLPEASTRGSLRPLIIPRWSCGVVQRSQDSITLRMTLPPGSYATILLRELMKPDNPLAYVGSTKTPNSCKG